MLEAITRHINDSYGSKRGLLNLCWFGLQHLFGGFARYRNIDWTRVGKLVFVCHGNICRSPLGEAVARQRFGLAAESFGLDCRDGAPADPRALRFASSCGIDLASHASRNIRQYEPDQSDLVVVMEPKHLAQLPARVTATAQVTLLGLWLSNSQPYVHDPYNSGENHFERCEQLVVLATEGIAARWQNRRP